MAREHDDAFGVATALNNLGVLARDQADLDTARRLFEESVAARRSIGDQRGLALVLANLADLAMQEGDYEHARVLLVETLTIQQQLGTPPGIAFALERLAGLAAAQQHSVRALRLSGAADALRAATGASASPSARALLVQRLSAAEQELGEDAADAAWTEGQALSLDEAVAYALSADDTAA